MNINMNVNIITIMNYKRKPTDFPYYYIATIKTYDKPCIKFSIIFESQDIFIHVKLNINVKKLEHFIYL